MSDAHRRLSFVLLPIVFLLSGLGTGGMNSLWAGHLVRGGMGEVEVAQHTTEAWMALQTLPMLAAFVGGVVGLVVGPLPVLTLGLVLSALGLAAVPLLAGEASVAPIAVAEFGSGLARIGLWASAAVPLAGRREGVRNGLFLLLWAVMNAGFWVVAPMTDGLEQLVGASGGFLVKAALCAGAAVLTGPLLVGWFRSPPPRAPRSRRSDVTDQWVSLGDAAEGRTAPSSNHAVRVHLLAGALILLCCTPWAAQDHVYSLLRADAVSLGAAPIVMIRLNHTVVIVFGLMLPAVFWLQARRGRLIPTLAIVGVGMLLVFPATLALLLPATRSSMIGLMVVMLVMTVGELMIGPMLLSRIAGDAHWRLVCVLVGIWLAMTSSMPLAVGQGTMEALWPSVPPAVLPATLVCFGAVVGLALLILAVPLHRRVYAPAAEAAGSAAARAATPDAR